MAFCSAEAFRTPFLKWPGGKHWLTPTLVPLIEARLRGTYYEPFLGGGAVFLNLRAAHALISDNNKDLIAALKAMRDTPEEVLAGVRRLSNTRDCYERIRLARPSSVVGRAVRFLYLNRTCWGGIYRLNRKGEFNVPYGNSGRVICRSAVFRAGAMKLQAAKLRCCDFEVVLNDAQMGDVAYCDPPYTTRGQNNGFVRYNEFLFSWRDQERLANACHRAAGRGATVIVSGLWHRDFLDLYPGWSKRKLERTSTVSRLAKGRRRIAEALVTNT